MISYKFEEDNKVKAQNMTEDTPDNQEDPNYDIRNYNNTLILLENSFKKNDLVDIQQYLCKYWEKIQYYATRLSIEELRIPQIVQLLMISLHNIIKDRDFNQFIVQKIFHTFNLIFYYTQTSNPYQFFTNSGIINILINITGVAEDELFKEIIKFLRLLWDNTPDCLYFEYSVLNTSAFKRIVSDDNKYSPETFLEYVYLVDQLSKYPNKEIQNCVDMIFTNAIFFIVIGNIEANEYGFRIINNLLNQNSPKIESLLTNSDELSQSVTRLLDPLTDSKTLFQIIKSLGTMCMHQYDMRHFPLGGLIQFLTYNNDEIKIYTAFALCNALWSNKGHFTEEDCVKIILILSEVMSTDKFTVISAISCMIPKIFSVIPRNCYLNLVQKGFFDTLYRIASIDSFLKSEDGKNKDTVNDVQNFFNVIKNLFLFADESNLWGTFADAFEESGCYQILTESEIDDPQIQSIVDSFIYSYDKRKNE
ncbi:hypothetical protein M9Y10_004158 [Tritrichomonas musculus]|uniref:Uncharacterized protein n=1 Tax=Tritrichomonas musculus TaxID=1915356 RepID=A0ABR2JR91_9EUKA